MLYLAFSALALSSALRPSSVRRRAGSIYHDMKEMTMDQPFRVGGSNFTFLAPECQALAVFASETHFPGWATNSLWLSTQNCCAWYGVECHAGGAKPSVRALRLGANMLMGMFNSTLSRLTHLETLDVSSNQMSGPLAPLIDAFAARAATTTLIVIDLHDNQLDGPLPAELARLDALEVLRLAHNALTGPLPAGLLLAQGSAPSALRELSLRENKISGSLEPLVEARARHRRRAAVDGVLQRAVLRRPESNPHPNAKHIDAAFLAKTRVDEAMDLALVSQAQRGLLPSTAWEGGAARRRLGERRAVRRALLGARRGVRAIDVGSNELSGTIPAALLDLVDSGLKNLDASHNALSGTLPATSFSKIGALGELALGSNAISGTIPALAAFAAAGEAKLTTLRLGNNQLRGSIPPSLFRHAPRLNGLWLNDNKLDGTLPARLGEETPFLKFLYVERNALRGAVPESLGHCAALTHLDLGGNDFATLPASFCRAAMDGGDAPLSGVCSVGANAWSRSEEACAALCGGDRSALPAQCRWQFVQPGGVDRCDIVHPVRPHSAQHISSTARAAAARRIGPPIYRKPPPSLFDQVAYRLFGGAERDYKRPAHLAPHTTDSALDRCGVRMRCIAAGYEAPVLTPISIFLPALLPPPFPNVSQRNQTCASPEEEQPPEDAIADVGDGRCTPPSRDLLLRCLHLHALRDHDGAEAPRARRRCRARRRERPVATAG